MQKPLMRIPYTGPLPPPQIIPDDAKTLSGAVTALKRFLNAEQSSTVILSGAGISVPSGLADYRGVNGTYTQNKSYRPIYFQEFIRSHQARQRYWARSFFGFTTLTKAKPNAAHEAVRRLGELGLVKSVITQNVDSLHPKAHPGLHTVELHGFLRSLVCLSCQSYLPRSDFQQSLSTLNPAWANTLAQALASGALDTEDLTERGAKGLKTNPDGDVDVPDAQYWTFRYPACPNCLDKPPTGENGQETRVDVDADGAWLDSSTAGVLKPAVVMFGESISTKVKAAAEEAIDSASRILVVGSSLATYSAWRLVRRAQDREMAIGILNLGGVRGEAEFFKDVGTGGSTRDGVRVDLAADQVLPVLVKQLERQMTTPVQAEHI